MIRLKKLLENVLAERVSDVVFHTTDIDALIEIVESDTFIMSPLSDTDEVDIAWAKDAGLLDYYYMSVARSVTSDYVLEHSSNIVFRLDGRRLNANMKSISYDYTAQRVRIGDDRPGEVEDEMEDRVLSKKPEIKGFSKYITGVYIPTGLIMEIVASRGGEYEADDLTDVIQKLAGMGVEIYNCSVRGYIDMVKGGDDENAVSMISSDDSNPTFNSKCKTNIDDFIRMVTDMADYYE